MFPSRLIPDCIKHLLLRMNRLQGALEDKNVITYQDKINYRISGYNKQISFGQEGHDRVTELVSQDRPFMISRLGSVELSCLHFFLEKRRRGTAAPYNRKIRSQMSNPAGFFPIDDESLDRFSAMFLEHVNHVDLMGVWFNAYESVICREYCNDALLVELGCLEPFSFSNPWSAGLAGKKVLVVHPFAKSIKKQYSEKRQLIFKSPEVLPEFELITLKAVQSIAGAKVGYATWFDAYRYMRDEISGTDFDVCIVGAGAYGLPLASCAKQMGKQAIHLGGITQLLFGIKGRRWETLYADSIAKLFNDNWIRPEESETPAQKDKIERGSYW